MREQISEYFKVLSDPNRLQIIELLLKGETCGCNLVDKLPISQPTLSYHLKNITKFGLANNKRDGNNINHYVDRDKINEIINYLVSLRDMKIDTCDL